MKLGKTWRQLTICNNNGDTMKYYFLIVGMSTAFGWISVFEGILIAFGFFTFELVQLIRKYKFEKDS